MVGFLYLEYNHGMKILIAGAGGFIGSALVGSCDKSATATIFPRFLK
jgi:FlaA1/EpsC-like NDP-sugar epimerase